MKELAQIRAAVLKALQESKIPAMEQFPEKRAESYSSEVNIQKALKTAVETASAARGERIGVIGGSGDTAAQLVTRAAAVNSERMVLVGPDMKDENGTELPGVFAAAAVAGAIACGSDPAMPLNGAELYGIGGLQSVYSDNDIDLLVQGGVTPLEDVGGVVSPVRGITTRTKTGSAADATWRELTTILRSAPRPLWSWRRKRTPRSSKATARSR